MSIDGYRGNKKIILPDNSVIDVDGRTTLFSKRKFALDVGEGDCCFICGITPEKSDFDNEHVIPRWILKRFNLFDKEIKLPNQVPIKYGNYKVPCCVTCNSFLSEEYESPISKITDGGYEGVLNFLKEGGNKLLYRWLSLIFVKTHLRDKSLRFHLDKRKGDESISDSWGWEGFHHAHSLARSPFFFDTIQPEVYGSFIALPVFDNSPDVLFDFGDLTIAQTSMIRLGDVVFIAVLNDSSGVLAKHNDQFRKMNRSLSIPQYVELFALMSVTNQLMVNRPSFESRYDPQTDRLEMLAHLPEALVFEAIDPIMVGNTLYSLKKDMFDSTLNGNEVEKLKNGEIGFLFDENGEFIDMSS